VANVLHCTVYMELKCIFLFFLLFLIKGNIK